MSRPGEIAGDKLRAIVERIERIEEEIKELVEGKKEIYFEAKGNGFDGHAGMGSPADQGRLDRKD